MPALIFRQDTSKLYAWKSQLEHQFRTAQLSPTAAAANRRLKHWCETEIRMRNEGKHKAPGVL